MKKNYQTTTRRARTTGRVTPKKAKPDPGRAAKEAARFREDGVRGFDATFSPPKSASALWALSPDPFIRAEVGAAHDAAVEAALAWLERHGAVTRRGTDGIDQVDTQGLTVALFRQHTSRTADPQLHTHAVISAKVQDDRAVAVARRPVPPQAAALHRLGLRRRPAHRTDRPPRHRLGADP